MKRIPLVLVFLSLLCPTLHAQKKPNILFFFADDWGRYARVYSDPQRPSISDVIKTPHFDRIGREGMIFDNAFVLVSSCGPSRASLTTGRYFWNCGSGAFLNGAASNWSGQINPLVALPKFPDLLRAAGYYARRSGKTIAFTESLKGRLHNLAVTDAGAEVKRVLSARLMALLEQTNDPRLSDAFDRPPYVDPSSLEAAPKQKKKGKGKSK